MRYAELHCKTNFSFLEGASHPDEFVARARELKYHALAVSDRNTLAGVVRAHAAAKEAGLKLLIGAETTPVDAPSAVLLATDRAAYGRLCRLITKGRRQAPKGQCHLTFDDIANHSEGLLAAVIPNPQPSTSNLEPPISAFAAYRQAFPSRCYLFAELCYGADDDGHLARLAALARRVNLPLVAAGDVHYHTSDRQDLRDVLAATRLATTVAALGERRFANAQRHLRSIEEIARQFAGHRDAVRRTAEIADRCHFSLDELRYEYPEELAPAGETPLDYLTRLTWAGAAERYPQGVPENVKRLIEHELKLIGELRYEAYFLTVWDLVRFARSRNILCQGRGSAANSAVCFALGVTSVDPARIDVLFERFVSRERNEAPDIDVDFEHERREEVLQYLYEKYGRERAGLTAVTITYRPRSAIRDVGRALGFSLETINRLAKSLDRHGGDVADVLEKRCAEAGMLGAESNGTLDTPKNTSTGDVRQLIRLTIELLGFPRHLSQHVGGMVMTRGPLCELTPIENAAMPGRTVIEWNKDDLDELGILKVDVLALGMLTAIRKCFDLVRQSTGRELTLATVPAEDEAVYDMICEADTMGVFQIESRAQMSMLPRLRPRRFYDLVIEVAIVRPGPIQGDMVHPYLRRRCGEEDVSYPSEAIREVLDKTLGVPLFQEQAMRLAVVAAGFTPGEADQLRRAMGAWRRTGVMERFQEKLIRGMTERGLSAEFADRVYRQIQGFGEYGFPESHAASFALLVYISAWLKRYYPAAFAAALINSQPMGFYAPAQLVRNAIEHGVEVRPADVNHIGWDCGLEGLERNDECEMMNDECQTGPVTSSPHIAHHSSLIIHHLFSLRLGFRLVVGLSRAVADTVATARSAGPFRSFDDFVRRTGLGQVALKQLAEADAFRSLGLDRRQAVWHALGREKKRRTLPLFDERREEVARAGGSCEIQPKTDDLACDDRLAAVALPELSAEEQVFADYETGGLSLRAHPLSFHRAALDGIGVLSAARLAETPDASRVQVAGLVLLRQRPATAKGITFVTLEDETGTANLVVSAGVWQRFHTVAHRAAAMIARGRLESRSGVIHVVVDRLEDLSRRLGELRVASRDFR